MVQDPNDTSPDLERWQLAYMESRLVIPEGTASYKEFCGDKEQWHVVYEVEDIKGPEFDDLYVEDSEEEAISDGRLLALENKATRFSIINTWADDKTFEVHYESEELARRHLTNWNHEISVSYKCPKLWAVSFTDWRTNKVIMGYRTVEGNYHNAIQCLTDTQTQFPFYALQRLADYKFDDDDNEPHVNVYVGAYWHEHGENTAIYPHIMGGYDWHWQTVFFDYRSLSELRQVLAVPVKRVL